MSEKLQIKKQRDNYREKRDEKWDNYRKKREDLDQSNYKRKEEKQWDKERENQRDTTTTNDGHDRTTVGESEEHREKEGQLCTSLTGFHGQQGCGETDVSPACGIIPKTKQNKGWTHKLGAEEKLSLYWAPTTHEGGLQHLLDANELKIKWQWTINDKTKLQKQMTFILLIHNYGKFAYSYILYQ